MARALTAGVSPDWCDALTQACQTVVTLTGQLGAMGMKGDVEGMMSHSSDYLELMSILVIAWQWLAMAAAAQEGLQRAPASEPFYQGKLCAAQYWFATEVTRIEQLATLCREREDSYVRMQADWF